MAVATIYRDENFKGESMELKVGNYDKGDIKKFGNDKLSSAKVSPGYKVLLFDNDGYRGTTLLLTEDIHSVKHLGMNDKTSSIKVTKENPPNADWMGRVANKQKLISELTIPGTHDSGTVKTSKLARTQNFSILRQLNDGGRRAGA